jgi:hypothetical protein
MSYDESALVSTAALFFVSDRQICSGLVGSMADPSSLIFVINLVYALASIVASL